MQNLVILGKEKEGIKVNEFELTFIGEGIDKKAGPFFIINQYKVGEGLTQEMARLNIAVSRVIQLYLTETLICYITLSKQNHKTKDQYIWRVNAPKIGAKVSSIDNRRRIKLHLSE